MHWTDPQGPAASVGALLFAWYQTLLSFEQLPQDPGHPVLFEAREEIRTGVGDQIDAVAGPISDAILGLSRI